MNILLNKKAAPVKLTKLCIKNFRSINDCSELRINPLEIFVARGIAAEADILESIAALFLPGSMMVSEADFKDKTQPICLSATFAQLSPKEKSELKRYLIRDTLFLEKRFTLNQTNKTVSSEYLSYQPEPKKWWLSLEKINQRYPDKQIPWEKIAYQRGIVESVREYNTVTEKSYTTGLEKLINDPDTEFDLPQAADLKPLGKNPGILRLIPDIVYIPAFLMNDPQAVSIEADKLFQQAAAYLLNRIIISQQIFFLKESRPIKAVSFIDTALNPADIQAMQEEEFYLSILDELGRLLSAKISAVLSLAYNIEITSKTGQCREKINIRRAEGVSLSLEQTGYDLKKALIFSLLDIMVMIKAGKFLENRKRKQPQAKAFILVIDKPELFLCAQSGKKFFSILSCLADFEQVIFLTNCANFVDIAGYRSITLIRSSGLNLKFQQAQSDVLSEWENSCLNLNIAQSNLDGMLFFAEKIILTEDKKHFAALLQGARNIGLFRTFPEEIGYSVFNAASKRQIIVFIKLLNAWGIRYTILMEPGDDPARAENKMIADLAQGNKLILIEPGFTELLGTQADISNLDDFNRFLLSPEHPSEGFRDILQKIGDKF